MNMVEQARVISTDALGDLGTAFRCFAEEMSAGLVQIDARIAQFQDWLIQRLYYWQHQVEHWTQALHSAEWDLERCQRDMDRSCYYYEQAVIEARRNLAQAKHELQTVQYWKRTFEQAVSLYRRQASRLKADIRHEVPKANAFLANKLQALDAYHQVPTQLSTHGLLIKGLDEGTGGNVYKSTGSAGEVVASANGDAVRLDEIAKQGALESKFPGGNFPVYDLAKDNGQIVSVKVRGMPLLRKLPLPRKIFLDNFNSNHVRSYVNDFRDAMGLGRNRDKFNKAASALLELKRKGLVPVCEAMADVDSVDGMKAYLRKFAVLQIPDDHVDVVRDVVKSKASIRPKSFGLSRKSEVGSLLERIIPIGTDSKTIERTWKTIRDRRS